MLSFEIRFPDVGSSETSMETIMHKDLLNQSILAPADNGSIRRWFCALSRWNETRKLRNATKRVDLVSSLDAHVLYDIGESDYRRPPHRSALWDHDPYKLLIDAIEDRGRYDTDSTPSDT